MKSREVLQSVILSSLQKLEPSTLNLKCKTITCDSSFEKSLWILKGTRSELQSKFLLDWKSQVLYKKVHRAIYFMTCLTNKKSEQENFHISSIYHSKVIDETFHEILHIPITFKWKFLESWNLLQLIYLSLKCLIMYQTM